MTGIAKVQQNNRKNHQVTGITMEKSKLTVEKPQGFKKRNTLFYRSIRSCMIGKYNTGAFKAGFYKDRPLQLLYLRARQILRMRHPPYRVKLCLASAPTLAQK